MQSGQETGVTAIALSAPSSFMQGDDAVNQERRFEMAEAGPPPTLQRPSESGHFAARARVQRTDAAMIIASAFRSMTGRAAHSADARGPPGATARNPRRPDALQRSRARRPRHRAGAHPAGREGNQSRRAPAGESAFQRWWTAARARFDVAREARRERRRVYRELDAYSDRELDEIGLRRADIPVVAREHPVLRRAA
jgi:uncharacterized protein YjiS (DUF1127 family)